MNTCSVPYLLITRAALRSRQGSSSKQQRPAELRRPTRPCHVNVFMYKTHARTDLLVAHQAPGGAHFSERFFIRAAHRSPLLQIFRALHRHGDAKTSHNTTQSIAMIVEAAPALGRKPTVEFKNDATRCKIYASPHQKKHDLSLVKEPVGAWTYSGVYNDDESMSTAYTDLPVHWSKPVVTEHNVSTACLIYDSNRNRSSVDVRETHSPSGRLHDNDAREAPSTTRSSQSSISTLRRKLRGQGALTSNSTGSFDDDDTISAARDSASTSGSSTPPRSLADKYMVMAEDIAACEMSSDYDSTR